MDAEAWRQAKGVLAEALLCPANEREAFINAHCADPSLRREVQAYLTQYDERFLESILTVSGTIDSTSSAAAAAAEAQDTLDIQVGDRVGPYIVLDRLGVGGMGHVFLGNDTRLQRKVALKCLTASASAAELRSRILHEARAAARITHPNIAIVHDVVEHEERPFLVMEYVEGENLAVVIKRERPSLDSILAMTRQLASALSAAHAKGIIHRDLKPANIQVTPDGSVKILDFGVAHAVSVAVTGTTAAAGAATVPMAPSTLPGDRASMHPGTPAYMSPEQMFGRALDQRSDIYSLGIIVYEMATGHRPYAADDPLDLVIKFSKDFLRPGDPETLPARVSDVVAKMLAVRPEDRYQTAGELESVVATLLAPPPVVRDAAPASRVRVAGRIAATAIIAAGVVAALGFMQTAIFNLTLGRTAPFNRESPAVWLQYGLRSLVQPAVFLIGIFIALSAVRFAVRVLSLSHGIDQLLTEGATRTTRLTQRLGLEDPVVYGQAVAGIGFLVLAVLTWWFWPVMLAWGTRSISTKPAAQFLPLQTGHRTAAQLHRFLLTVLIYAFSVAIVHVARLRASKRVRVGSSAFALLVTMLVLAVAMCEAPYRVMSQNQMPRVDVAGERCFLLGENAEELLVHCPERIAPRNRVVRRTTADIQNLGFAQSIFDPPETTH